MLGGEERYGMTESFIHFCYPPVTADSLCENSILSDSSLNIIALIYRENPQISWTVSSVEGPSVETWRTTVILNSI